MGRVIRGLSRRFLRVAPPSWCSYLLRRIPQLADGLPRGEDFIFGRYLGRYRVAIDPTYPIERAMLRNGYDSELLRLIGDRVPAGGHCLDVGANVGAIALALADRVGPTGRVYAFEPGPFLFERLVRNVRRNPGLGNVLTPVNLGVSDRPGELFWNEDPTNRGNASLYGPSGTRVRVIPLDDFFAAHPLPRLDFVKVDVEGMEYEVIRGGRETLRKHRPLLYLETLREFEKIRGLPLFARIEELLSEIGYALYKPGVRGELVRTTSADLGHNTVALAVGQ
jgi:FkbM family methyltransferase